MRQDRRLIGTLTVTVIYNVFAWPFTSMVPVIAQGNCAWTLPAPALLPSMDGIGAFVGAVLMALVVRRAHFRTVYVGGVTVLHGDADRRSRWCPTPIVGRRRRCC